MLCGRRLPSGCVLWVVAVVGRPVWVCLSVGLSQEGVLPVPRV